MNKYAHLANTKFAHTFAVINHTTGEVFTTSCDCRTVALANAYRKMDGENRYWLGQSKPVHCQLVLIDVTMDRVVDQIN